MKYIAAGLVLSVGMIISFIAGVVAGASIYEVKNLQNKDKVFEEMIERATEIALQQLADMDDNGRMN